MAEKGGGLMRQPLFAGLRLRASYRYIPMDNILALLDGVDEQDEDYVDSYCLHHRRLFRHMKEEE
jgi:hypothetical protein